MHIEIKEHANLHDADLHDADLQNANLQCANLQNAKLQSANLQSANLQHANLQSANLQNADLYGAELYGADLHGANLQYANLYGADLYGADLHNAYRPENDIDGWQADNSGHLQGIMFDKQSKVLEACTKRKEKGIIMNISLNDIYDDGYDDGIDYEDFCVRLNKDDVIILTLDKLPTEKVAKNISNRFKEAFPNNKLLIISKNMQLTFVDVIED